MIGGITEKGENQGALRREMCILRYLEHIGRKKSYIA